MHRAYRVLIIYFMLFSLLLLLSGAMIFEHKIGFGIAEVQSYYLGDAERFIAPKSFNGMLKTLLPHLFVFGLLWFVASHFLRFTAHYKRAVWIALSLFWLLAIEALSPFFMLVHEAFAFLKLFGFFGSYVAFLAIFYLLLCAQKE
ncbi:MAG: hypothetical protein IE916_01660 [Epsilonproteobacteria bacterium]|nr:hypothetical protein [Campylobacterota bacterium]